MTILKWFLGKVPWICPENGMKVFGTMFLGLPWIWQESDMNMVCWISTILEFLGESAMKMSWNSLGSHVRGWHESVMKLFGEPCSGSTWIWHERGMKGSWKRPESDMNFTSHVWKDVLELEPCLDLPWEWHESAVKVTWGKCVESAKNLPNLHESYMSDSSRIHFTFLQA